MSGEQNPLVDIARQIAAAAATAAIGVANNQLRERRLAELSPAERESVSVAAREAVARAAKAANADIDEINAKLGNEPT